jgi:hypothetical protein
MQELAGGYGSPLLNYHPPFAYYLTWVWHALGLSLVQATNLTFILCPILAGIFMFLLVNDMAGEQAGILAALLCMQARPLLYNAIYRGGLAEVVGWALVPLVLWASRRMSATGQAGWLLLASLSCAALLLSHVLVAAICAPLLIIYVLATWCIERQLEGKRLAVLALVLGVGICAFFWIPLFLERDLIQIDNALTPLWSDFRTRFVDWRDLLAGPMGADLSPWDHDRRSIGWPHLLTAALGVLAAVRMRARQRWWFLSAATGAIILLLMILPLARPIWDALPPLRFLQFPWRLLAPAILLLSLAGGGVGCLLTQRSGGRWLPPLGVTILSTALFVYNLPLYYPPYDRATAGHLDLNALYGFEVPNQLGLTSSNDYLPVWVREVPWHFPITEQAKASRPLIWLDRGSLPEGVQVLNEAYRMNDMSLTFSSPEPFDAIINQFYFPGWTAYVNGARVAIEPRGPHGLIGVRLPAGRSALRLRFGETPVRKVSDLISLCSLAALATVTIAVQRRRGVRSRAEPSESAPASLWWALGMVSVACLVLHLTVLRAPEARYRTMHWLLLGQARLHHDPVNFGHEVYLMGYSLPQGPARSGEAIPVNLYWRALGEVGADYSVSLQLVDDRGFLYGQHDQWRPGDVSTSQWQNHKAYLDAHSVLVLPGTPPGEYTLRLSVYAPQGERLDALDEQGQPLGASVVLGRTMVASPATPPDPASLDMTETIALAVNSDVLLLGSILPQSTVVPGERIRLSLFWCALQDIESDYELTVSLGYAAMQQSLGPLTGHADASSRWQREELRRGQYDLVIPADIAPGANPLYIALTDSDGGTSDDVLAGVLDVAAIARRMEPPVIETPRSAMFGDTIRLLGYHLETREVGQGGSLNLRLYWQAAVMPSIEYTVFVQLLDSDQHISAQSDSMPVQGARPTTGWITGEVIVDDYHLAVRGNAPVGPHRLVIGFYEPASGVRLPVTEQGAQPTGDSLSLETVWVR